MNYRELTVWQASMDLVESCYRLTSPYPASELYGLTSQIRRAAVSIPSNIAEGHCRRSTKAYMNHVSIALGSGGELSTCLELSNRLGLIERARAKEFEQLQQSCESVGKMLYGLHKALDLKVHSSEP